MENKHIYGECPLIAFMKVIERQKMVYEFHRRLNELYLRNRDCKASYSKKNIEHLKIPIIPISDKLEWVNIDYIETICNAFNIPRQLLETTQS